MLFAETTATLRRVLLLDATFGLLTTFQVPQVSVAALLPAVLSTRTTTTGASTHKNRLLFIRFIVFLTVFWCTFAKMYSHGCLERKHALQPRGNGRTGS